MTLNRALRGLLLVGLFGSAALASSALTVPVNEAAAVAVAFDPAQPYLPAPFYGVSEGRRYAIGEPAQYLRVVRDLATGVDSAVPMPNNLKIYATTPVSDDGELLIKDFQRNVYYWRVGQAIPAILPLPVGSQPVRMVLASGAGRAFITARLGDLGHLKVYEYDTMTQSIDEVTIPNVSGAFFDLEDVSDDGTKLLLTGCDTRPAPVVDDRALGSYYWLCGVSPDGEVVRCRDARWPDPECGIFAGFLWNRESNAVVRLAAPGFEMSTASTTANLHGSSGGSDHNGGSLSKSGDVMALLASTPGDQPPLSVFAYSVTTNVYRNLNTDGRLQPGRTRRDVSQRAVGSVRVWERHFSSGCRHR